MYVTIQKIENLLNSYKCVEYSLSVSVYVVILMPYWEIISIVTGI